MAKIKSKFLKMESDVLSYPSLRSQGWEREPRNEVAFTDMGKLLKRTAPEYLNKVAIGLHPHI